MKGLKGTKSEENVKIAFAGESQARSKYIYFAEAARKEGNEKMAELFEKMATNELSHARIWFNLIQGTGSTQENLLNAAQGENYEWKSMYPDFAEQARADGLPELAKIFEMVANIEKNHERTFMEEYVKAYAEAPASPSVEAAAEKLEEEELEVREQEETAGPVKAPTHRCMFCGYLADQRLDVCPLCQAIGAFEKIG